MPISPLHPTCPHHPLLAYTPFIDPIHLPHAWFFLLIPMALLIAMAYKAARVPDMAHYWRQTLLFSLQIILGITGLAAGALFFIEVVLPSIV